MTTLVRNGVELRYEVNGRSGPALLLPQLNFSWPDYLDLKQDEEIALGGGIQQLASGLDRHGLQHLSVLGRDHEAMLAHINEAVTGVLAWFDQL